MNLFNYMDRAILGVLIQPIKEEFNASDTQMGILTGLAFAIFYAICGFPKSSRFWPFTTYGLHRASSTGSSANRRRRATERLGLRDANRRHEQKTSKTACGHDALHKTEN